MLFSSALFLFLFLPVVLAVYYLLDRRFHNVVLLVASLVFYAWGEKLIVGVMLLSIVANYLFGLWVDRARGRGGKAVVFLAVVFNIGLLALFKYSDWLWDLISSSLLALGMIAEPLAQLGSFLPHDSPWRAVFLTENGRIRLPIGISFFTFQALSYVIDVYRRDGGVLKNPLDFALYKALFPQLIAGPIVRYCDVEAQIRSRATTRASLVLGVQRFVIGLGKKMLIANVAAKVADQVFAISPAELTPAVAWLGIVCYTLQIYFDFSGYSDMAIGLGHMFAFTFLENFRHPYVACSITDFWRRWHISLSTWFRDYVYIPLGGSRTTRSRTYFNLVLVFFLCGLWHGASWSFVVWGLYHGLFLVLERVGLARWLDARVSFLRHAYVLLVVMVGWVFFRAADLPAAGAYLLALSGLQPGLPEVHHLSFYVNSVVAAALVAGVIGATPWLANLRAWRDARLVNGRVGLALGVECAGTLALALVLFCSVLELSGRSYNPFIYFRF